MLLQQQVHFICYCCKVCPGWAWLYYRVSRLLLPLY